MTRGNDLSNRSLDLLNRTPFEILHAPELPQSRSERQTGRERLRSGKQTHDANIVATMLEHSVQKLVTDNVAHFQRYPEIELIDLHAVVGS